MQAIEVMARTLYYPYDFGGRYPRRGQVSILRLAVVWLVAMPTLRAQGRAPVASFDRACWQWRYSRYTGLSSFDLR